MKVVNQKGKVTSLEDRHFLAEGGEGKLYALKDRVYKIYHDSNHLVPEAKLNELQILDYPGIIKPLEPLYNQDNKLVGYIMYRVSGSPIGLARLFTSSYWRANNITSQTIVDLVQKIRDGIAFVHKHGFLQVDGNEFNYLITENHTRPWFVDIDSYQTPVYPATGIMSSIRDFKQAEFNQGSDWYSFAVIAFQMFSGVHPFKGNHPDFKKGDIQSRVIAGVSVFDSAVSYPASVRDFGETPVRWLDWFKDTFIAGNREAPPDGNLRIDITRNLQIIQDGKSVEIKKLVSFKNMIKQLWHHNGHRVVRAGGFLYVGKQRYRYPDAALGVVLDLSAKPLLVSIRNGFLVLQDLVTGLEQITGIGAGRVAVFDNRIYLVNNQDLAEVAIHELGGRKHVTLVSARKILPNATSIYAGMFVQNILGKIHLMLPVSTGVMPFIAVPELDKMKIIDARFEKAVAVFLVADHQGNYKYFRFIFNQNHTDYSLMEIAETQDVMNFVVLGASNAKQLLITLGRDKQIEIMNINTAGTKNPDQLRIVNDDKLKTLMRLSNDAGRVSFYVDDSIYSMQMR